MKILTKEEYRAIGDVICPVCCSKKYSLQGGDNTLCCETCGARWEDVDGSYYNLRIYCAECDSPLPVGEYMQYKGGLCARCRDENNQGALMDSKAMMEKLGIKYLTMEADGTKSRRILFDVPTEIAEEMRTFLGAATITFPRGWNEPEKVALMLDAIVMQQFLCWCARRRGYYVVRRNDNFSFFGSEDMAETYRIRFPEVEIMKPIGEQTRNQHQMSGRID